jgi:predicted phosphohydrolase
MLKLTYSKELHTYYISDLHLDQKKDKKGDIIKIKNKKKYLKEQISYLMNNIDDYENNLLCFLGDISENLSLSKDFFSLLREEYSGKILYCLGNHEYYGFKKNKNLKESFLQSLRSLNIIVIGINGQLFAIDKYNCVRIVKYMNVYEIKSLIYCCTGCGIKDLTRSITLNEEEESLIAKEQNENYQKAIDISKKFNLPLIIMSHYNPEAYIENIIYDKNIYYLYGHTHWNNLKRDLNIYADAQIGYEEKPCYCKELYIERIPHKFESFENGIHKISLNDYYSFICKNSSFSMSPPKPNSKYWNGNIYMIKKDIYYMFFIKYSKSLCILSGGARHTANYDLDYYFTHFEEQIQLQCYWVKDNWYSYMKKIGEYIKNIGGMGHIHGAIIDIDFYNHIFVNPLDGSIMPYYSPMVDNGIVERFAYKTISELIMNHCPELIYNENKYQIDFPLKYALIESNNTQLTKEENNIMDYKINRKFGHNLQRAIENNIISIWIDINKDENNNNNNNLLT